MNINDIVYVRDKHDNSRYVGVVRALFDVASGATFAACELLNSGDGNEAGVFLLEELLVLPTQLHGLLRFIARTFDTDPEIVRDILATLRRGVEKGVTP